MPRQARIKSRTGIYHIILRGINRQIIFEDMEDHKKLLEILLRCKEIDGFDLYAYCIMSNHIHLLMRERETGLEIVFRRFGAAYVYWYNMKYSRNGHLFQGRYKSEAVESKKYFLTVLRYIHQNPLKSGIVEDIADYKWSSYREYVENATICDISIILALFSKERQRAIKLFKEFHMVHSNDKCLEHKSPVKLKDKDAAIIIAEISGIKSTTKIQTLETKQRDAIIKQCKIKGLSIRQISRLTGVSFGIVRRI